MPTIRSAKPGAPGVGQALRIRAARRATQRFALPGVASRFTRRTGIPSDVAAETTGPVT